MGKQYGYYGVILGLGRRPIDGDYMIDIITEDGITARICASCEKYKEEDFRRGMVVIFSKAHFWRLRFLNTDIAKFDFNNIELLQKIFLDRIYPTQEEIKTIEDDLSTYKLFCNLAQRTVEDYKLWFEKFVFRKLDSGVLKTTDNNGEILNEFYFMP